MPDRNPLKRSFVDISNNSSSSSPEMDNFNDVDDHNDTASQELASIRSPEEFRPRGFVQASFFL